jgi:hypothetical protein
MPPFVAASLRRPECPHECGHGRPEVRSTARSKLKARAHRLHQIAQQIHVHMERVDASRTQVINLFDKI